MRIAALLSVISAPSLVLSLGFDSQELQAAEVADQNFLMKEWRALESDMVTLQQHLATETRNTGFLQLRNATSPTAQTKNQSAKLEVKGKPMVKKPSDSKKLGTKLEPSDLSKPKSEPSDPSEQKLDRLAQTESMMKGLTGKAMLAPMLGMLNGMYQDQKKRIGELNKREAKSKERFAQQQADFDAKIKSIKEKHDAHKLNDEFFKNETRDYTRQFKYWEGVRSRNHRQFHNALKITHGMMQREKDMISKYEAAMSMKMPEDSKKAAVQAAPVEAPEVVFMQQRKAVIAFIQEHLTEVRGYLAETLKVDHA